MRYLIKSTLKSLVPRLYVHNFKYESRKNSLPCFIQSKTVENFIIHNNLVLSLPFLCLFYRSTISLFFTLFLNIYPSLLFFLPCSTSCLFLLSLSESSKSLLKGSCSVHSYELCGWDTKITGNFEPL